MDPDGGPRNKFSTLKKGVHRSGLYQLAQWWTCATSATKYAEGHIWEAFVPSGMALTEDASLIIQGVEGDSTGDFLTGENSAWGTFCTDS